MGMKYIPTVRDQKAALRFQKKQNPPPNFKKSSDKPTAVKSAPPPSPAPEKPASP